ncbi:MAG: MFS transporter [Methylocystis sp.]|uniref:MFS transporter n=1 Tax=Methylocystis sp. TaxID=1911079 RepID=UPI003DA32A53
MNKTVLLLIWARGLRDFGDGFVAVLLPVYLTRLGLSSFEIGALAGTALLGSALLTLAIGLVGNRYDARHMLIAAAALMAGTGVALSIIDSYALLLIVAFVGSVNPSGGSASSFVPVEHAVLTRETAAAARTSGFARYSLIGGLAAAGGALAASLPEILIRLGWPELLGVKAMFAIYAILGKRCYGPTFKREMKAASLIS